MTLANGENDLLCFFGFPSAVHQKVHCKTVGLMTWCLFLAMPSCLVRFHWGLVTGLCGLCACHPSKRGKAATFECLFVQPGVVAGLQGIRWRPWVPGLFGRSYDRSITGGYTASPCFQNRSEGGKRTCADFFAVCLYIDYHPRSWERASQEAPFGLREPVSHTKEPCLKTNSLDFGLCWGFPTLF